VIDLHCHILPGVDDGPPDMSASVAMARAAATGGIETIVATPHVRDDYPFDLDRLAARVAEVNAALVESGVAIDVVAGAEVAIPKLAELDDSTLGALCLGDSPYLLVESPYVHALPWVEEALDAVRARGLRPLLAHPERAPSFIADPDRLARIVDEGVLCSVTAGSMAGVFGRRVRRFTGELFERGLVHNVASDAHDLVHRRPDLLNGFDAFDSESLRERADWFTKAVPAAILAGRDLPPRPESAPRELSWLRRTFGRDG
jgi:protein-tyrosine phosphatase